MLSSLGAFSCNISCRDCEPQEAWHCMEKRPKVKMGKELAEKKSGPRDGENCDLGSLTDFFATFGPFFPIVGRGPLSIFSVNFCPSFGSQPGFHSILGARQKGDSKREKPVSGKICGFLRFPAKICGFLRFSAQICDSPKDPSVLKTLRCS